MKVLNEKQLVKEFDKKLDLIKDTKDPTNVQLEIGEACAIFYGILRTEGKYCLDMDIVHPDSGLTTYAKRYTNNDKIFVTVQGYDYRIIDWLFWLYNNERKKVEFKNLPWYKRLFF